MNTPNSSECRPARRRPGLWLAALALTLTALPACDDGGGGGTPADAQLPVTDLGVRDDRGPTPDLGPSDDQGVEPDQGVDAGPPDTNVWAWLEARRTEVRQSPDHLPARAEALVAAGDAEAIFAFVRDTLTVVPTGRDYGYHSGDEALWRTGPRGVLRSGSGTPREIADVLADLLTRAGHPAHVVLGTWFPEGPEAGLAFWTRPHAPLEFNPGIARADLEALRADAPFEAPTGIAAVPDTTARRLQLAQALKAHVGVDGAVAAEFEAEVFDPLPLVAVEMGSGLVYAHPFVPDAVFGEPYGDPADFDDLSEAYARHGLYLGLVAHTARGREIVAAEARLDLAEAVGRPIAFGLVPMLPTAEALVTAVDDVPAAIGAIVVRRDADMAEDAVNVFTGAPVGLEGDALLVDDAGGFTLGDGVLEAPQPGVDASAVVTLTASLSATRFPLIELSLRAADADDVFVPGLGTDAFAVRDEDRPRPYVLRRNTEAPLVTVLYDTSGSMPAWVLDNADAIAAGIAANLQARYPRAQVTLKPTDSDLWGATLSAMVGRPDAIVYLTDGDATDSFAPTDGPVFAEGPAPLVIAVGSGAEAPEVFDEFVARTGATVRVADDQTTALALADATLTDLPEGSYVLNFRAPDGAAGERTVTVALPNGVQATGSYTVPEAEARVVADPIVGLSLDVGVEGEYVRRHVAGYSRGPVLTDASEVAQHAAAIRQSLRDRNWLFVEGDALLPAVALDEHIAGLLSTRGAFELTDFSVEGVTALAEGGIDQRPPELLGAFLPLPTSADAHLFAHLGRLAIVRHQRRPVETGPEAGALDLVRSLDLVPVPTWSAAGPTDGAGRFAAVLEGSLAPALAEAAMYAHATANLLADDALVEYAGGDASFADPTSPAARALTYTLDDLWYAEWRFVDAAGAAEAAWVVNARTGEAHALLSDGSGGGAELVAELRAIATSLDITNATAGILSLANMAAGGSFGAVITLGKVIANAYGAVTIIIATISAAWEPEEVQRAVAQAACEASKHLKITPFGLGPEPLQWYTAAALTDIWGVACP